MYPKAPIPERTRRDRVVAATCKKRQGREDRVAGDGMGAHGLVPAEGLSSDATKGFAYRVVWNARNKELDAISARAIAQVE